MKNNIVKRAFSAIVAAALCTSCMSVMAADEGWKIEYFGTGKTDRTQYYAEFSMAQTFDGSYSLHVVYPYPAEDGTYVQISTPLTEDITAGEYEVKIHTDGIFSKKSKINICGTEYMFNDAIWTLEDDVAAPSGESTWDRYTARITLDNVQSPDFKFVFAGPVTGCFIDEVSLSKVGDENNLIPVGGFESITAEEVEYDGGKYIPYEIMTAPTTVGGVAISWRNPDIDSVAKISLYDVTDGKETFLDDGFGCEKNAINVHEIDEALTESNEYLYKLLFEYSDGVPDMEFFIGYKAMAAAKSHSFEPIGEWKRSGAHTGTKNYALQKIYIDKTEKKNGEASLKIASNTDAVYASTSSSTTIPAAVNAGDKYQLSFWYKTKNNSVGLKAHMNWSYFDEKFMDGNVVIKGTKEANDWKQIIIEKSSIESTVNSLTFLVDYKTDGIWIDDVEMYKLDEAGQPVGENLIAGGDFEGLLSNVVPEIMNVQAEPGEGSAELSWKLQGEDIGGVNIYQKVGDFWVFRGNTGAGIEKVNFTNLQYEHDYEMKIVPVNSDGVEGEGSVAAFKTDAPDYMVLTPGFYYGNELVDKITNSGYYTARVNVKNNAFADGMKFELLVGIFKDGALYKASSTSKVIDCTPANSNPTRVSASFEIPSDGSDYTVRLYSLDSKFTGKVLLPCVELD